MNLFLIKEFPDQGKMADELAENEGLVPVVQQFLDNIAENFHFRAGNLYFLCYQTTVAAGKSEFHNFCQDFYMPVSFRSMNVQEPGHRFLAQGFVKDCLLLVELHLQYDFRFWRQLFENLGLNSPQNIGRYQFLQPQPCLPVIVAFYWHGKLFVEMIQ